MKGRLAALALLGCLASTVAAYPMQYGALTCDVLDEGQTRAVNSTFRRMHFAFCVNTLTGDTLGALVRRKGTIVCNETGLYDFSSQTFIRDGGSCPYPALETLRLPLGTK